jgi:DNA-binding cell septation regulator SpoVG
MEKPMPTPVSNPDPQMPITLLEWKPRVKGALRGFAKVRLGRGLLIHEVPVLAGKNGRGWAALPGRPILNADGSAARDAEGKQRYAPIMEWADRATSDRFTAAVIAAILAEHPDALDGSAQ